MPLTKSEILSFLTQQTLAVVATVSDKGFPESALVEFAVTQSLELVFDTIETTRKCQNLRLNPKVALVVGWEGAQTLQIEGVADEPASAELDTLLETYFQRCPKGLQREGWPGLTYFRIRPVWARLSNYQRPRRVEEITFP